ncbi:MAG: HAMP domain-containing protein, partial [Bdellovibrionota bacterium]
NEKGIPTRQFIVVAFVRADRIIASLKESRPNESLVMSSRGDILAHADSTILQSQKIADQVLFDHAKDMKVRAQVLKYDSAGEIRFGAFSKTAGGHILVLSSISEKTAFKAVNDLVTRSLLFGSILITFAFILAIGFSRSLTRPIETLVGGMKQVSDGDLNTKIQINSGDEISSLAHHFNLMIGELKKSRGELEDINRELENKVKERTIQLEERNVAVKEAQEALLRSTRLAAVGEVAGLAAHEVLNPLTSIIAKLNDLKTRLQTEKKGEIQFLVDLKQSWEGDVAKGGFAQLVKAWQAPSTVMKGSTLWQEDLSNIAKVSSGVLNEFDKFYN